MNKSLAELVSSVDYGKELSNAYALTQLTLEQLGVPPEVSNQTVIEFNNRFLSKAGDAGYKTHRGGRIRLGTKYFAVASEKDKVETVIHEACHVADDFFMLTDENYSRKGWGSYRSEKGHGINWRGLMYKVGYPEANRFHCVNTKQFKTFYNYKCNCGQNYRLTAQMGGRLRNQTKSAACSICKEWIPPNKLVKVNGFDLVNG